MEDTHGITVIIERDEVCTLCAGRGTEFSNYSNSTALMTCRSCHGTGIKLIKTVTKTVVDIDALADAVAEKLSRRKPHEFRALDVSKSIGASDYLDSPK